MNPSIQDEQPSATTPSDTYEPPRVESVLTSEELEREVLYAGEAATPPPPDPSV